jgi:predicted DNA-binding protein (UPF0251 family)
MSELTSAGVMDWLDNPIVRQAYRMSPDDSELVDVLDKLLEILHELEDRFPGVPFRDILSTPDTGRDRMRIVATLRQTGASEDDISIVFGDMKHFDWDQVDDRAFELVHRGVTKRELLDLGYTTSGAESVLGIRTPLTPTEEKALDLVQQGMTIGEASRRLGLNRATTRRAVRKYRYREWLAAQQSKLIGIAAAVAMSLAFGVAYVMTAVQPA